MQKAAAAASDHVQKIQECTLSLCSSILSLPREIHFECVMSLWINWHKFCNQALLSQQDDKDLWYFSVEYTQKSQKKLAQYAVKDHNTRIHSYKN